MTVQQAFERALQHHQAGRLAEAEALYRQILSAQPDHADARQFLGVIAHQEGRHDLAVDWIEQSLRLHPNNPAALCNLGETYRALGRLDDAIAAYRRALDLRPDHAQAHHNLANALRERGQFTEAVVACRRALELFPDAPVGYLNLGNAQRDGGHLPEAMAAYQRALEVQPGYAEAANNFGSVLRQCGRLEEAVGAYRRALAAKPAYGEASNNLGNALRDLGRLDEAAAAYHRAIEMDAGYAEAWLNLGVVRADEGRFAEAAAACQRAIALKPELPEAHLNLGAALAELGQLDSAIESYERVLALRPGNAQVHINLGNARQEQGRIGEAIAAYRRAMELGPGSVDAHSNLIYALHFDPEIDARTIIEEQGRWNRKFGGPARRITPQPARDRNPERRLRVGYVSADLRDHVVGRNVRPLFRHHDHRSFLAFFYSGVIRPDLLTKEFRERADRWRSTLGVSDEALAQMIREDEVDILVDLAQHTAGNRLTMFTHRPAPVQVSFAGYPASAGVEAIGYRISDRYLESARGDRNEEVVLVDSFWCYDPCGMDVPVNALPALGNGRVTFGSLNNFCKVNETVLRLWARVLGKVKDSRLILLSHEGSHRQRTREGMEREGIEPQRVEFAEPRGRQEYLELYHRLDVVLDTFPYNGHTTSLDALWMGVPVVSLAGEGAVSRAGLSQLSNLGLREWVALSEAEYVDIAMRLAGDLPRLAEMRQTLRGRMEVSVLMDAPRFARGMEAAYRAMWEQWCRQ